MNSHKMIPLVLCLIVGGTLFISPALAQFFVDPALQAEVLRPLWTRGPEHFQRHWEISGPLDAAHAARRAEGDASLPWTRLHSWTDEINPAGVAAPDSILLARTTVEWIVEDDATLLLGAAGAVEVFVNGRSVHRRNEMQPYALDQEAIPVRLREGANTILLRLRTADGANRFALRAVARGALVASAAEISPFVEAGDDDDVALRVRTHHNSAQEGAPVEVAVLAPGGAVVGRASTPRGDLATFATAAWPDGPYEIRCTTRDAWGDIRVAHLAWFKGEPRSEIAALLGAAEAAPADPEGDTLRLLAAIVRDRIGDQPDRDAAPPWGGVHALLFEFRELLDAKGGGAGGARAGGFVRLAYADPADGSTQFCRAYLPTGYDPAGRWPLIIQLHGFNPQNPALEHWWGVDSRHHRVADHCGAIVLEPHGRGNAQYRGIGEQDVLRALDEARERFSIDEDRVYLTGESMGGHGTWSIASRHPDLFAAAAPVFGGWDFRLAPIERGGMADLKAADPLVRHTLETQSSFVAAEGLMHVPLLVEHGDADAATHVENSRFAVRQLQRWGYDVHYREHPGRGHEDLGGEERRARWLLQHRRVQAPRTLRLRAPDLGAAAAYWFSVDAAERPLELIQVDAGFVRPGVLRVDTANVAAFTLSPPSGLLGGEDQADGASLVVVWNGARHAVRLTSGAARLGTAPPPGASAKVRGLEGGISDIVTTPFIVVIGTASPDPVVRRLCQEKADAFAANWLEWQKHPPRVRTDGALTAEEERTYSLILIGGPDANSVTRRMEADLPLRIASGRVTIGGQTWEASDACVQMIHPSPSAPSRYVLVVAGTSATGLYFWKPILWRDPHGFATELADWNIRDGRRVVVPLGRPATDAWIAAGVFDRAWRSDPRWIAEGDAALRAGSPLRTPYIAAEPAAPDSLALLAGRYELFPGEGVDLRVRDDGLWVEQPGRAPVRLRPEGDAGFGHPFSGATFHFASGPGNRPAVLFLNNGGNDLPLRRVSD